MQIISELALLRIDSVASILTFFVPGLIFIKAFNFICSKEIDEKNLIVYCVSISFVLVQITHLMLDKTNVQSVSDFRFSLIAILTSIILAVLTSRIYTSTFFEKIIFKNARKTLNKNIWNDVLDLELGTNIYAYIKNENIIYCGTISIMEEKGEDSWILLVRYMKLNKSDGLVVADKYSTINEAALLRLKDIDRIEIVYDKNSKRLDKLKPK